MRTPTDRLPSVSARLAPALVPLALLASCADRGPRPNDTNVVMVVVDTLRRDHVSCYGYERETTPHIDALAADGVRFETAYSQSPWTTPSLASLLTSRLPQELGLRSKQSVVPDDAVLLGEMLEPYDYATCAVVSHKFCSERWNFDQGFAAFDDTNALGHQAVTSPDVTERALEFVDQRANDGQPFFLFVHYFDPHLSYIDHPETGFERPADYTGPVRPKHELAELNKIELQPADRAELERLYDTEVAFTDRHVGRLFERLREHGLYDDALIVVTSDHGESFLDHGELGHGRTLYGEVLNVPLIVKYPEAYTRAGSRTQPVALLDVVPTVLDVVGVPAPVLLHGHVLGRAPRSRTIPGFTHMNGGLRSLCDVRFKLIERPATGERELYNLARDPEEQNNMLERGAIGLAGQVLDRMQAEQKSWDARLQPIAPQSIRLGPATLESLRELGYAGE